jgi:putative OPT family oligopeptide transporter
MDDEGETYALEGSNIESPLVQHSSEDPPGAELTVRACLLAAVLSCVLGSASIYMGLFAGQSTSASIPSAVVSMAILKNFKDSGILENNLVQTGASSGQSVSAGLIFTLPALIMLNDDESMLGWSEFRYLETTAISITGGLLGIMFSVPIRRAVFGITPALRFPEAVACSALLRAGNSPDAPAGSITALLVGGLVGGLTKICTTGLILFKDVMGTSFFVNGGAMELNVVQASPALFGIGYIVGIQTATSVLLGGIANWILAVPIVSAHDNWNENSWAAGIADSTVAPNLAEFTPTNVATYTYTQKTRFAAIGMMLLGTAWTFCKLANPLYVGIKAGIASARALDRARAAGNVDDARVPRTERDTDLRLILGGIVFSIIPLVFIFLGPSQISAIAIPMTILLIIVGFVMAGIGAYLAGLLGSSNSPISGVTVITVLFTALLLRAIGPPAGLDLEARGPMTAIIMGAVIACSSAISADNMQDLKTGHLLGATPWKQQFMQAIGVTVSSFVFAPVLNLMQKAYGFGAATLDNPNPLPAPQSAMMASVAQGVIRGDLPYDFLGAGIGAAVVLVLLNLFLEHKNAGFQIPVMAFAVGAYLPLELATTSFLGALVALVCRLLGERAGAAPIISGRASGSLGGAMDGADVDEEELKPGKGESSMATLFAGGLITGESLVGVLLAIPIVAANDAEVMKVVDDPQQWPTSLFMLMLIACMAYFSGK